MIKNEDGGDIQKDYYDVIHYSSVIKHYVNGMSRILILWIVKYYGLIHGYAILKEIDKFYAELIEEGSLKKSNPSKIYPILNGMEELNLISHELKMVNNKQLKFFMITDEGRHLLDYMYSRINVIYSNSQWEILFEDMDGGY